MKAASPHPLRASRRAFWLAPALVFALALLVTGGLLASIARSVAQQERAAFASEVGRTADAIRERIETVVTLLRGTAGLFAVQERVDQAEFQRFIERLRLTESYPGILGIGFSERIAPESLAQREAEVRAWGLPGFRVWPDEPRAEYHSIVLLQPLGERNRAALGYDMSTEPTRRAAMSRARDEGRPAASGKVVLVQEIEARKQAGFLIYLPLYAGGSAPPDLASRRRDLLGFVYAPLRVDDLFRGVRGSEALVDYELFDGQEASPEALMRSTREAAAEEPLLSTTRELQVAGQPWLLRFSSRPRLEQRSQRWLVPWLAAASVLASALLAWITFVQARARREAEQAAAQRRENELALQASEERERERAQRLEQLYAELRESDRRKDEFLAVLAHELRNPLAPIRSSLEILRRAPASEAGRRANEIAQRQVAQMVRLIDDLLDVSRISRGKLVLQRETTRVADLVEAAVEASRPGIEARRHRLHVGEIDPALRLEVDPARIAQVLTNLLNNASTYTPPGGDISISVQEAQPWVRIAVRDTGIGIERDQLQAVFELFVQVQRVGGGGGLGIGLSLAARLADLHGGHIEAHSEGLGKGSEFVLVLPREGASGADAPAEAGAGLGTAAIRG